jgi:hypothetical protein
MAVTAYHLVQYTVECDECGCGDVIPDNNSERVHSVQQAIKWAHMHKVKDGRLLCDRCFKEYKNNKSKHL